MKVRNCKRENTCDVQIKLCTEAEELALILTSLSNLEICIY